MARKKFSNSSNNLHLKNIDALNDKQAKVLRSKKNLVLAGSAGTGKTFLASWLAFNSLQREIHSNVVFIRSAVSTRDIGFLPGTEREKMQVYKLPYIDICSNLFERGDAFDIMEQKRTVSFQPTSFVRGLTFRDSFIIIDECQNMTYHELDSLITRLDDNCRIIFCGDIAQADLFKNGFGDFYRVLREMDEFDFVEFGIDDVVRGSLVKSYLKQKASFFAGK